MTTPKDIEEMARQFNEYCNDGYNGGKEGLRCTDCDRKYRGESAIRQLCPVCRARQTLSTTELEVRKEERIKTLKEVRNDKWNTYEKIDREIQFLSQSSSSSGKK